MTEQKPNTPIQDNSKFEKSVLDGLVVIAEAIVSIRRWVVFFGILVIIGLFVGLLNTCGVF